MTRETSRVEIEKGKLKTGEKFQEVKKRFEKDVKTKKAISEAARSANVEGTDEGMKKIKRAMESAGKETDNQFDKDSAKQKEVVEEEALPREKRLAEMAKKTQGDINNIGKALANAEVDAAKKELKDAVLAGQEDIKFSETKNKEQENDRKNSENVAKEKGRAMKSSPVKFKR